MEKSKSALPIWQIAKVNLRHNFLPLLLLSALLMVLAPVLFGTTDLDSSTAAVPLEMFLSVIGIILLVPIFQPEQDDAIRDVVASKYVDSACVYLIRAVYSVAGIVLLVLVFSSFMLVRGCEITAALIGGAIADAVFLGAVGVLASAVTGSLPVSFMVPFLYYVLNLTMKSRLGNFNLFGMMDGNYRPNLWLFMTGIGFIAVSILGKKALDKR